MKLKSALTIILATLTVTVATLPTAALAVGMNMTPLENVTVDSIEVGASIDLKEFSNDELCYRIRLPKASEVVDAANAEEFLVWQGDHAVVSFAVQKSPMLSVPETARSEMIASFFGPELAELRQRGLSEQQIENLLVAQAIGTQISWELMMAGFEPVNAEIDFNEGSSITLESSLARVDSSATTRLRLVVTSEHTYILVATWEANEAGVEETVDVISESLQVGE